MWKDRASRSKVEAAADEQAPEEVVDEEPAEEMRLFDSTKHDLIIDFKSVAEIPFDSHTEGVKALRGIVFDKGTCCVNPEDISKLLVVGEWQQESALSLVHFAKSTARDPELLLYFVDYGYCNSEVGGITVETLPLPLCLKKNTYQSDTRLTPITDVAGFETINHGTAPWSTSLKATLKQFVFFKQFEVFSDKGLEVHLKAELSDILEILMQHARDALNEEVAAIIRQDKSAGEKQKAMFTARLEALYKAMIQGPLQGFDKALTDRITTAKKGKRGLDNAPAWLSTPTSRKLQRGEYEMGSEIKPKKLRRGALFIADQSAAEEKKQSPPKQPTPEKQSKEKETGESLPREIVDISEEEFDHSSDNEEKAPEQLQKRAPKKTEQFSPVQTSKQRKKEPRMKPKNKETAGDEKRGLINPRNGLPYIKGPYNSGGPGSRGGGGPYPVVKKEPTGASAQVVEELENLKETSARQASEIVDLQRQLMEARSAQATAESALKYAEQSNQKAMDGAFAQGKLEVMGEATKQFQLGLQAGASLAGNNSFAFPQMAGMPGSS